MNHSSETAILPVNDPDQLDQYNTILRPLSARDRVCWALENLPSNPVMTTSFGIQSAVLTHMVSRIKPDLQVIFVDTGFLFTETLEFADQLCRRLDLNLKVYRPRLSALEIERQHGALWNQGVRGLKLFNHISKIEPLARALSENGAKTWIAGLRNQQSESRKRLPILSIQDGHFKLHPMVEWHNQDVHRYLKQHDLPYHPLWHRGYVSVGDVHTSRPISAGQDEEQTRFFGIQRECGIHINGNLSAQRG